MQWHSVLLVVFLLTVGTQAFAPIYWMKAPSGGLSLMPKGFRGTAQGLSPPQELIVRKPEASSSNMVPYFTAKADSTIRWDDMGWCIEAGGRSNGDVVRVNQCNGGATQKWNWIPDGHGRNMIQLKDSNQCLEVKGGLSEAPIALQDCASQKTDAWKFEESLPLPSQASAQSPDRRHAMVTLLSLNGVWLLCVGAWLLRPQNRARRVTAGQGDVNMAVFAGNGFWSNDSRPAATVRRAGKISMMADSGVDWSKKIKDGLTEARKMIGQPLPSVELDYGFPPEKVNIYERVKDKKVILVGLPGAFTPIRSTTQLPAFLEKQAELKERGIDEVIVYCCNDGAVMNAWGKKQGIEGSNVTFMGDPSAVLTDALKLRMEHPGPVGVLGPLRCQRHALVVINGVVESLAVAATEDDPAGDETPDGTLVELMLTLLPDEPKPAPDNYWSKLYQAMQPDPEVEPEDTLFRRVMYRMPGRGEPRDKLIGFFGFVFINIIIFGYYQITNPGGWSLDL